MTTRKPVFIEKIMPVKLPNEQVYYEHGGNPFKGLHRWYSRKPLSFSRASVLGSLLPGDVSIASKILSILLCKLRQQFVEALVILPHSHFAVLDSGDEGRSMTFRKFLHLW